MNTNAKNLELAAQLMYDQAFRRKVRNKDPIALAKLGFESPDKSLELKVVSSTRDTLYIPFPLLPDNHQVSAAELKEIQAAGKTAGSLSTLGSAGTGGTACSTVSTFATAGTAGTAGTG